MTLSSLGFTHKPEQKFKGTLSAGAIITREGVGKFAIFNRNRLLSRKWYGTGP